MSSRCGRLAFAGSICLLLLTTPARAQVLMGYLFGEKLASPTFNLGFEVGVNFTTLDGLDGAKRLNRPAFGLFGDWRFSEHLHLTGAFLPIAGRGATDVKPLSTGDPELDSHVTGGTMERSLGYIELPLLLKWAPRREEGLRIGAGPSFGVVTGANDRYESTTTTGSSYVLERDIGDQLPGLDMGLSVDVEWRFWSLAIAARYTHGLTDMRQTGSDEAVYSRMLTGTGRIYLGRKPDGKPKSP